MTNVTETAIFLGVGRHCYTLGVFRASRLDAGMKQNVAAVFKCFGGLINIRVFHRLITIANCHLLIGDQLLLIIDRFLFTPLA